MRVSLRSFDGFQVYYLGHRVPYSARIPRSLALKYKFGPAPQLLNGGAKVVVEAEAEAEAEAEEAEEEGGWEVGEV